MGNFPRPLDFPEEFEETGFGICDCCGEYVKDLLLAEGEWICENCEKFR
jgi:formylmethanofuran dehydrogenase subunit E